LIEFHICIKIKAAHVKAWLKTACNLDSRSTHLRITDPSTSEYK
jgi:hypothetical protein